MISKYLSSFLSNAAVLSFIVVNDVYKIKPEPKPIPTKTSPLFED